MPASLRARTAARTPALPAPAPVTSPKSALRQAGWMGYSIDAKYSLGAVAMDDLNVDTQNLKAQFGRDVSVLVIWADNRANASPITVSTDGATLRMADGSVVNALRTREVLETAKVDRQAFVARFSSPFTVSAGGVVEGQLLFIPPGTDLSRVQAIYLSVDGVRVSIPGRIFSAAEKAERMNRKSTPQQDPSNL